MGRRLLSNHTEMIGLSIKLSRCEEYRKRSEAENILESYTSSEYYISKALTLFQELGDEKGIRRCKEVLVEINIRRGEELFNEKKYQDARDKLEESQRLYSEIGDSSGKELCLTLITQIDTILLEQEKADISLAQAYQYFEEGAYKEAVLHAKNAKRLFEELENVEKQGECDELLARAEQEMEKQRLMIIFGTVIALCALAITIGIYVVKKKKQKSHVLEDERKILNDMFEKGIISDREYEIAKKEMLGKENKSS